MRNELHYIERGENFQRRKEIYEELHPETRQGMRNGQTAKNEIISFLGSKPINWNQDGQISKRVGSTGLEPSGVARGTSEIISFVQPNPNTDANENLSPESEKSFTDDTAEKSPNA
jgi:hypothetical protein